MKKILTATALSLCVAVPALAQEAGFQSAISSYNAQKGGGIVSQPKVRADHKAYHLHGRIKDPSKNEASFLAMLTSSEENEPMLLAAERSGLASSDRGFFYVVIPDELEQYYYENATIDGGFDVVGSYVDNAPYYDWMGVEKTAPIFYADYIKLWSDSRSR